MVQDRLVIPSLKQFFRPKDSGTHIFYLIVISLWILILVLPFSQFLPKFLMTKFHLRNKSFPVWMASQLIPSMYNFDNELWISNGRLPAPPPTITVPPSQETIHVWVNHYPLHWISFNLHRRQLEQKSFYIYLKSSYRNTILNTSYRLSPQPSGMTLEFVDHD